MKVPQIKIMDQFKQNILLYVPHNIKAYSSKLKRTYTLTIGNFEESLNRKSDRVYLRGLEELTKEINIDGVWFTPMRIFYEDYKKDFSTYIEFLDKMHYSYMEPTQYVHYNHFRLMIKWGFDVFGYIDEDRAKNLKTFKHIGKYEPFEDKSSNDLKYLDNEER